MATTAYSNWDFHKYRVQQDLVGGQFINAESTLIAAGPPSLTTAMGSAGTGGASGQSDKVYPIGLLETFGLQQSRQLQRIFEIGSSRSYFIPGRTIGSISIGRTFYHGNSLLRVLYAYYAGTVSGYTGAITSLIDKTADTTQNTLYRNPGFGELMIDLASDLFAQPTGMAVYFKDAQNTNLGAFYLEENYVQGHQMTISSGSVLIMEGVSMQYDLLVPVKVTDKVGITGQ